MQHFYPGTFIAIEGIDGSGKSTLAQELARVYNNPERYLHTREPGGTVVGEALRDIVKGDHRLETETELFLHSAARVEHLNKTILPALKAGQLVVTDRYLDSTYAYQCLGDFHGQMFGLVDYITKTVIQPLAIPDRVLWVDTPVELALERSQSRGIVDANDSLSKERLEQIRSWYVKRHTQDDGTFLRLDGTLPVASLVKEAIEWIEHTRAQALNHVAVNKLDVYLECVRLLRSPQLAETEGNELIHPAAWQINERYARLLPYLFSKDGNGYLSVSYLDRAVQQYNESRHETGVEWFYRVVEQDRLGALSIELQVKVQPQFEGSPKRARIVTRRVA